MNTILFIDDNADILEANRSYFEEQGFLVTPCLDGPDAIAALEARAYDCVVLDVMMPGMDGYEVCKQIRRRSDVPVVFLSCLDRPDDKIQALMLGGDAYMTKPYDLRELHAQVAACLRRGPGQAPSLPDFYVDREQRIVHLRQKSVMFSRKEMALLSLLLDHPGQVLSKRQINEAVWPGEAADENRLHALVKKVRQKTAFAAPYLGGIESVYGIGYRLQAEGDAR